MKLAASHNDVYTPPCPSPCPRTRLCWQELSLLRFPQRKWLNGGWGWPTQQQRERTFLTHPCQQGVRKPRLLFFLVTEEARMSAQKGWGGWEGGGKPHEGSQNGLKFFNLFVWMPWFPTYPALDTPLVRGRRSAGRGPCSLLLLGRGGSAQGGLQSWRRTPGRGRGEEGRAGWGTNI